MKKDGNNFIGSETGFSDMRPEDIEEPLSVFRGDEGSGVPTVQDETVFSELPQSEEKSKETHAGKVQRKATALTVANLVNTFISVISAMIIPRLIDQGEYGVYKLTYLAFNTLLPFLGLGLTQGLYYFLPTEKKRFRAIVYECYIIYGVMGILFSVVLTVFGLDLFGGVFANAENAGVVMKALGKGYYVARNFFTYGSPRVQKMIIWLIPYSLITLMTTCTSVIMNIRDHISTYIKFNLFCAIFSTIALTFSLWFAPSAQTAVIAMTGAKLVEGIISITLTVRCLPRDDIKPQMKSLWKLLAFSFPLGLSSMIGTITKQMDHLFIAGSSSEAYYGIYEIAAKEVPIIDVLLAAVSMSLLPEVRRLFGKKDFAQGHSLYINVAKRLGCVTLPIMMFLMFWSKDFITFMYSSKYITSPEILGTGYEVPLIFRVYLLYFIGRICLTGPLFTALGMNVYLFVKTICSCALNAVFTYLFMIWMGPVGAAVGTIASGWVIMVTMILPVLGKKTGMHATSYFPFAFVGKILLASLPAAGISYAVSFIPALAWNGETVTSFVRLAIGAVVFFAVLFVISKTVMKKDYEWMYRLLGKYVQKAKAIFAKIKCKFSKKKA